MDSEQRRNFVILSLVGLLYFCLMIWPNSTRAADPGMISIFELDESAQYPHAIRMVIPAQTVEKSLRNFFFYQHYYYGFPFYLVSVGLGLLPVKLLAGIGSTSLNMLAMRQAASVLPMVLAALALVYAQTRFSKLLASLATFIFLLTVPAVFANSAWWHPDSLLLLFIALTLLFLDLDDLRFGKYFYLAAFACGLATGTKLVGLFFFLAIPLYIIIGYYQKRISLKKALASAALFLGVMAVTFVLSNPFLLDPEQRFRAWRIQLRQAEAMSKGWNVYYEGGLLAWLPMIKSNYGQLPFVLLAFAAAAVNIWKNHRRLLNVMILAFVLPFLVYVIGTIVIKPTHFLLPAALPLYSCLAGLFFVLNPPEGWPTYRRAWRRHLPALALIVLGGLIVAWQAAYNLRWSGEHYRDLVRAEQTSQEIQFFNELERDYLSRLPAGQPRRAYRDVRIYFPERGEWTVDTRSRMATYPVIQEGAYDLVAIWNQRAMDYTNEGVLENAVDPAEMEQAYQFYRDVRDGQLTGYRLLYKTECCVAFLREGLYEEAFEH